MNGKKLRGAALSLTLCAALLTACGGGDAAAPSKAGGATDASGAASAAVTVNSIEELLDAIAPGAEIVVAPGYYNMSETLEELWRTDAEGWNDAHEYVQLRDCYDGTEVAIQNADNLSLSGGGAAAETELVIEPRYGTVLNFINCSNLKLSGLTLGHTDTGECSGSVVGLSACRNVELRDMDLYGCGVIGLECVDGAGDVYAYDTIIRDCSYGPLDLYDGAGRYEFHNCVLTGSDGGGYYNGEIGAEIAFYNCTFGQQETNYWHFLDGVAFEDCTWSEVTMYPDYSDPEYYPEEEDYEPQRLIPETLPESMEEKPFGDLLYGETLWHGFQMSGAETGEAMDAPSGWGVENVNMTLRGDGTGSLNNYYADRNVPFLWEYDEDDTAKLSLWTRNDGTFEATLYRAVGEGDSAGMWLSLRTPDALLWMY